MLRLEYHKVFVQIGTYDGNDEFMHLVKRWHPSKVILVEPNPVMLPLIQHNYQTMRGVSIESVAITEVNKGMVQLVHPRQLKRRHEFSDYNPCFSLLPMDEWGDDLKRVDVPSMTFMELCEKHKISDIHFLQIDTEGYDVEIIKSIDFSKIQIDIIVYENWDFPEKRFSRHGEKAKLYGRNAMRDGKALLESLGYDVAVKDKGNFIARKA